MFVNQMGGSNAKVIQTLLFVSGLNTLMQSLLGTQLPSVIGGSYAFVIPMTSILHAGGYHLLSPEPNGDYCTYHKFERTMRGMQGALIVASCFQMLIGFLGVWRNVVRFLTPLSMVPLMTFTELGLYYLGFQMLAKCVEIGIPELILMVSSHSIFPIMQMQKQRDVCVIDLHFCSLLHLYGAMRKFSLQVVHIITLLQPLKLVVALIALASFLELLVY